MSYKVLEVEAGRSCARDGNDPLERSYRFTFMFDVLPRVTVRNTFRCVSISFSWLVWYAIVSWHKKMSYDYDIQGTCTIRKKGIRYYITLGLYH